MPLSTFLGTFTPHQGNRQQYAILLLHRGIVAGSARPSAEDNGSDHRARQIAAEDIPSDRERAVGGLFPGWNARGAP
jgi:hypothetical protein